jgi:hypothetical protein
LTAVSASRSSFVGSIDGKLRGCVVMGRLRLEAWAWG